MLLCKLENQNQFNLNTDCPLSRWLAGGGVVEGRHLCCLLLVMEMTLQLVKSLAPYSHKDRRRVGGDGVNSVEISAFRAMTQHSTFIHV